MTDAERVVATGAEVEAMLTILVDNAGVTDAMRGPASGLSTWCEDSGASSR